MADDGGGRSGAGADPVDVDSGLAIDGGEQDSLTDSGTARSDAASGGDPDANMDADAGSGDPNPPEGPTYALDLSGVSARQQMQQWDAAWVSEYEEEFGGYEWQVDPGGGGQVGVWTGSGNPSDSPPSNRDYSQLIAAGPPAGSPVRVRMRFEYRAQGAWVSSSHSGDGAQRHHYEVALQEGALRIYKFWGPSPFNDWATASSVNFTATPGAVYWLYLTETRVGDDVNGDVTISGTLLDDQLQELATISLQDTGQVAGEPTIPSSNQRGFGAFAPADGTGPKILEWYVEPAP
jgi:hypothetical protein